MTGGGVPSNLSVLNTTVLSKFAYDDELWAISGLSGICTGPVVREEVEHVVEDHLYLQSALDILDDVIPVVRISDTVTNRESVVRDNLDSSEAQAFAPTDGQLADC